MAAWFRLTVLLCLFCGCGTQFTGQRSGYGPVVQTHQGKMFGVRGTPSATGRGRGYSFLGVPYATAPLEELRFEKPKVFLPWTGLFNATYRRSECPWFNDVTNTSEGSDDCHRLDIFTPTLPSEDKNSTNKMPVLVFFPGGNYRNQKLGFEKFMMRNILVVVVHYRTGIFGFLFTPHIAHGNYGLFDAVAALEWIQKNIGIFGGDKERVTIMGDREGATLLSILLVSPKSRGLFQRVVIQSPSNPFHESPTTDAKLFTSSVIAKVGCDSYPTYMLLYCMGHKTVEELVRAQWDVQRTASILHQIFPVSDISQHSPLLPDTPWNLIQSLSSSSTIPIMIILLEDEGLIPVQKPRILFMLLELQPMEFLMTRVLDANSLGIYRNREFNIGNALAKLRQLLKYEEDSTSNINSVIERWTEDILTALIPATENDIWNPVFIEAAKSFYLADANKSQIAIKLSQAVADCLYWTSAKLLIHAFYRKASVYLGVFSFQGRHSLRKNLEAKREKLRINLSGFEDSMIPYLFDVESTPLGPSVDDRAMSDLLSTIWTNFITTGKPITPADRLSNWLPVNSGTISEYYNLSLEPSMQKKQQLAGIAFWEALREAAMVSRTSNENSETENKLFVYSAATWILVTLLLMLLGVAGCIFYFRYWRTRGANDSVKDESISSVYYQDQTTQTEVCWTDL